MRRPRGPAWAWVFGAILSAFHPGVVVADAVIPNPHASGFGFFAALAASGSELAVANLADPFTGLGGQPAEIDIFAVPDGAFLRALPTPAEVAPDENFGTAIAWFESGILVGARAHATAGSAYLLDPDSGAVKQTFRKPQPRGGEDFGYAVAGSGTLVAVGADADSSVAFDGGAVYLFDAVSGALVRRLVPSDAVRNEAFGRAVAFAEGGDVVVLDAFHLHRLSTSDGTLRWRADLPHAGFGWSIAVVGPWVAVGDTKPDGAVHLFDARTGDLRRTIPNPTSVHLTGVPGAFGATLAPVGATLLVGAPGNSTVAYQNQGQAFLVDLTDGSVLRTFDAPAPRESGGFGAAAVAVHGGIAMVDLERPRSVFLFSLPCGDGVRDPGEQCDDGNLLDGDGCSSRCQQECDDARACAADGVCTEPFCVTGLCFHDGLRGLEEAVCRAADLPNAVACSSRPLRALRLRAASTKASALLRRSAGAPVGKARRLVARATKRLHRVQTQAARLARPRVTPECAATIRQAVQDVLVLIRGLAPI